MASPPERPAGPVLDRTRPSPVKSDLTPAKRGISFPLETVPGYRMSRLSRGDVKEC